MRPSAGRSRNEIAVPDVIVTSAPSHCVFRETRDPETKSYDIPQHDKWHQSPNGPLEAPDAYNPNGCESEAEIGKKKGECCCSSGVCGQRRQQPRQRLSEKQSKVTFGPHMSHDDKPTHALMHKLAD